MRRLYRFVRACIGIPVAVLLGPIAYLVETFGLALHRFVDAVIDWAFLGWEKGR
jgi:hypothetical protein